MKKLFSIIVLFFVAASVFAQAGELVIKKADKGLYLEHKVAAKEGLYAIGRLYNVNPKFIASFNNMGLNDGLNIGQALRIPLTDTNFLQKGNSGVPVYYKAGNGETVQRIANTYGNISASMLKDWNDLSSDNVPQGSKLIVGFLQSKEMQWTNVNNAVATRNEKKPVQEAIQQEVKTAEKQAEKADVKEVEKPVVKEEPKKIAEVKPLPEVKPERKPEQPVAAIQTVKEEAKQIVTAEGYFKTDYSKQSKSSSSNKNATLNGGIFKTTSGVREAKYYALLDGATPGTIIQVTNPVNGKSVYAKVLGEMSGIRQNQGYDVRISNSAASALQLSETDKFVVKVAY